MVLEHESEIPYRPISCDFHDRLEELSTLGKSCLVRYGNEHGEVMEVQGRIDDIYTTRNKEEYLKMTGGQVIRLDHIREVVEM